ncbi:hypothetical protein PYCCODRAFT_1377257, partial [Trametes coccinea BRFM310]
MSSNIKIGDDAVRVPRLELGGSNWVLYKDRLLWAADAKGYRGHLDGTAREPIAPQATAAQAATAAGTAAPGAAAGTPGAAATATEVTPDQAQVTYEAALSEWRKGEANVKQLIASTIPDSLFMKIRAKPTARAIW